jgi:D-serine deaminase-like pyridoxal phosphate-dependent protein
VLGEGRLVELGLGVRRTGVAVGTSGRRTQTTVEDADGVVCGGVAAHHHGGVASGVKRGGPGRN